MKYEDRNRRQHEDRKGHWQPVQSIRLSVRLSLFRSKRGSRSAGAISSASLRQRSDAAERPLGLCRPLNYLAGMEFEWDAAKSEACFAERGFDFAYAVGVFLDPDRLVEPDDRLDYGEPRYRMLGRIEDRVFVIVYTPRGRRLRVISARKANSREVRRYEADAYDVDV